MSASFDAIVIGAGFAGLGAGAALRARIHPSIFFPGFDATPLGGISLGYWGREVGSRIAEALAARSSRPASGQMAASASADAATSCQPSAW